MPRYLTKGVYRDTGRSFRDHLIDAPDEQGARELAADLGMVVFEVRTPDSVVYPRTRNKLIVGSVIAMAAIIATSMLMSEPEIDPARSPQRPITAARTAQPPKPQSKPKRVERELPHFDWDDARRQWPSVNGWVWHRHEGNRKIYSLSNTSDVGIGLLLRGTDDELLEVGIMGGFSPWTESGNVLALKLASMAIIAKQVSGVDSETILKFLTRFDELRSAGAIKMTEDGQRFTLALLPESTTVKLFLVISR